MAKAESKTRPEALSAADFISAVPDPARRADAEALAALMARVTGEPPVMWGPSIIGFGRYRYRYESGREGESLRVGFSPRAKELVIYGIGGAIERLQAEARLGKIRRGQSCVYVKKLADVDLGVFEQLVADGFAHEALGEIR